MKQVLICLLLIALPVSGSGAEEAVPNGAATEEFRWSSFQDALGKATLSNKLIFVDVYTDWCGWWCKKLDKDVYSRDDIRSYLDEKFVSVKLNAEDKSSSVTIDGQALTYPELAAAYGVRSYPTTLFLLSDGKLLYALRGYHPPERFMKALRYFGERTYVEDLASEQKQTGE